MKYIHYINCCCATNYLLVVHNFVGSKNNFVTFSHVVFECRRLIGRFYHFSSIFLPSCVGTGLALLIERKSRRGLLAGYVATVVSLVFQEKVLYNEHT